MPGPALYLPGEYVPDWLPAITKLATEQRRKKFKESINLTHNVYRGNRKKNEDKKNMNHR
jgi:hypothetical protein